MPPPFARLHEILGDRLLDATSGHAWYGCVRRLRLVVSVVGQVASWGGFFAYLWGMPSPFDIADAQIPKGAVVPSAPIGIALCIIGFISTGPLLWTSGWWFPRLPRRKRRLTAPLTAMSVLNQPDEDLVRFRECLPQVELCQRLIGQYAGPLGGLNMGIMSLRYLSAGDMTMITLIRQLEYLTCSLDTLGIRCPSVYGGNGESDSAFRVRLLVWNMHLAELAVMIPHDDLARARQLEPLEPTKAPTSDKSDGL